MNSLFLSNISFSTLESLFTGGPAGVIVLLLLVVAGTIHLYLEEKKHNLNREERFDDIVDKYVNNQIDSIEAMNKVTMIIKELKEEIRFGKK